MKVIQTSYWAGSCVKPHNEIEVRDLSDHMVEEIRKHEDVDVLASYDRQETPVVRTNTSLHPILQTFLYAHDHGVPCLFQPSIILAAIVQNLRACAYDDSVLAPVLNVTHCGFDMTQPSDAWTELFDSTSYCLQHKVNRTYPFLRDLRLDLCHSWQYLASMTCLTSEETKVQEPPLFHADDHTHGYCGIPAFYLTGSQGEWHYLKNLCSRLLRHPKGSTWAGNILTMVEEVLRVLHNKEYRREFWDNLCTMRTTVDGKTYVKGWILALFPYDRYRRFVGFFKRSWRNLNDLPYRGMYCTRLRHSRGSGRRTLKFRLYVGLVGGVVMTYEHYSEHNPEQPPDAVGCGFSWGVIEQPSGGTLPPITE